MSNRAIARALGIPETTAQIVEQMRVRHFSG
jgi:hypothetical protein